MTVRAYANFERRADFWNMSLTIPTTAGLSFVDALPGADMTVYYLNSQGIQTSYVASLLVTPSLSSVSSSINVPGYWDFNNDGIFETYGSVKWEAGNYDNMFVLRINVDQDFNSGQIVAIDGHISSTYDFRDGINYPNSVSFYTEVLFFIGYDIGDVNGDGYINVSDVTLITDYLLSGGYMDLDQYQLDAADVNRDGQVSVLDASLLTDIILSN